MTATQFTPGQTLQVPLNTLFISPLNVRRHDSTDITELAALIRSQGVLQNLLVVPEVDAGGGVRFGVVGGGRRMRALNHLAQRREIVAEYPVPVKIMAVDTAEQASLAENSGREAMHPADEFEAFQRQRDAGIPIEDIAATFGVTPLVVRRRLKLANISPRLLHAYRQGELKLDQLQALALTDRHDVQERVWAEAKELPYWKQSARELRDSITDGAVATADDAAARFVGLDAYEAAGGHVVRDLFSDRGDGYVADKDLLQKLFAEKLEAVGDQVRAEGWSWVEVRERVRPGDMYQMGRSKASERALTEAEQAEIAALEAQAKALDAKADTLEEDDDSDEYETVSAELVEVQAKIKAIKDGAVVYSERQMKKAGAIVGLNHSGQLEIHRGLIKEADKPKKVEAGVTVTESGKPAHPESLVRKLSAHRTMAIQASLADQHRLALDTLCYSLASTVLYSGGYHGDRGIRINANSQTFSLRQHADDIEQSKAWGQMAERRAKLLEKLPENPAELFAWLQEQSLETVLDILAFCTASCVDGVQHNEGSRPLAELEEAAGLDMSDWWEASAGSYFKHVRKETAIAVVKQVDPAQDGEKLAKLKKGELDKHAEVVLSGTRWLPRMLAREVPKA
ncbi:ParB N-terminal domain-containing protein (plasmid) [Cupriavidus pinatubonensis]|uniref:ParB/RepB/Spo0J family partition protein n=1 Tax=Cupriavidus pinatubonensis TaxID=248026 RepID=UPI001C72B806|nr:ParB/RepB/Spo0J family partition protein [Cupriavidus pinatubonensis]QYY33671.1 ParB N-terminal domain-containing protein [Cupriavidus pinatubonensis]